MTWHPDIPEHYRNQIVTGDSRELAEALPEESVDMVFCDPPYLGVFIPMYGWLAKTAARVLQPGGYLFAYGAAEHQPEILRLMQVPGLDYFWTFVLLHNGGYPRVWYKRLLSGYKPVFAFTKGKPSRLKWMATVGSVAADKRYHEWGQGDGFAMKIIEMLTDPGDVVLDPCAGGGTTAAACKMLGRNYVSFEIDPATAEKARERVANTKTPLFVLEPEQAAMPLEV